VTVSRLQHKDSGEKTSLPQKPKVTLKKSKIQNSKVKMEEKNRRIEE